MSSSSIDYCQINITKYFEPYDEGTFLISPSGYQKTSNQIDTFSQIFSNEYCSDLNNKFCVDSCWETGNVYYVNQERGWVRKLRFSNGSQIASLSLRNPIAVSVIQYANKMVELVSKPPQEDKGCWIADKGLKTLVRTDNNLNVMAEVTCVENPVCVVARSDSGCYAADDYTRTVFRVRSDGVILFVKSYDDFSPALESVVDLRINELDQVWVASQEYVYKLSETLTQYTLVHPVTEALESEGDYNNNIESIDVDRQDNALYVVGSDCNYGWLIKYANNGDFLTRNSYLDIARPIVLRVVQNPTGSCFYILRESTVCSSSSDTSEESLSSTSVSYSSSESSSSSAAVTTTTTTL